MNGHAMTRVLYALESHGSRIQVQANGSYMAQCPSHDDKNPSLHVSERDDRTGATVWCHAGCEQDAVLDQLGLTMAHLFDDWSLTPYRPPIAPMGTPLKFEDWAPAKAAATPAQAAPATRSRLGTIYTRDELRDLPVVEPLIEGVVSLRSSVVMVGAKTVGKTFTALSMACSVATGHPWLGHTVVKARSCYVVGEGTYGLDGRISAWEVAWGTKVPAEDLTVVARPFSLSTAATWTELCALCVERGVRFVVLDTLSSLAPDADETKDAALIMRYVSDTAATIDGTAMLIHHPGWSDAGRTRGSYAFEANADEELVLAEVAPGSDLFTMTRKKVREGPDGALLWLRREPVAGQHYPVVAMAREVEAKVPIRERLLLVLRDRGEEGATAAQLVAALTITGDPSPMYRTLGDLVREGKVTSDGPRGRKRYWISPEKTVE